MQQMLEQLFKFLFSFAVGGVNMFLMSFRYESVNKIWQLDSV